MIVAFVALPALGHFNPTQHLMQEMGNRGHEVEFFGWDFIAEKYRPLVESVGGSFRVIDTPYDSQREAEEATGGEVGMVRALAENTRLSIQRAWKERKPDVVVVDFFSCQALSVAAEMGIPGVANCPGPVSAVQDFLGLKDASALSNFLGIGVMMPTFSPLAFAAELVDPLNVRACRLSGRF